MKKLSCKIPDYDKQWIERTASYERMSEGTVINALITFYCENSTNKTLNIMRAKRSIEVGLRLESKT